jgi:anti-sigma factor RsiW
MADDLHSLSAPYALDALSADERARFEEHLAGCDACRADLAGLNDAASSLAFAVEGPAPPAELRGRILDAARAEPSNVVPFRPRRSIATSVAAVVAIAATAAAVAIGIHALSVSHSLTTTRSALRVLADPDARHVRLPGAKGQVVVAPSGTAVLALRLPAPPKGKTYEAWVANPRVHRAGEYDGRHAATLPIRLAHGAQVMVTLEPSGGVDAPTTSPLFTVRV